MLRSRPFHLQSPPSNPPKKHSLNHGDNTWTKAEVTEVVAKQPLASIYDLVSQDQLYSASPPLSAAQQTSNCFLSSFSGLRRSFDAEKYASLRGSPPGHSFDATRNPLPSFETRHPLPSFDRWSKTGLNGRNALMYHRATNEACSHPLVDTSSTSNSYHSEMLPSCPSCSPYKAPQDGSDHDQRTQRTPGYEGRMSVLPSLALTQSSSWSCRGTFEHVS